MTHVTPRKNSTSPALMTRWTGAPRAITSVSGFACQATATGLLAQRAGSARSSALGLYVTCYYLGGSTGATAPGFVWARAGWPGCVALVIVVLVAMGVLVARFWPDERPAAR